MNNNDLIDINGETLGEWFSVDGLAIQDDIQLFLVIVDLAAIYGFNTSRAWKYVGKKTKVSEIRELSAVVEWSDVHAEIRAYNYPSFDIYEIVCPMAQEAMKHLNNLIPNELIFDLDDSVGIAFGLYQYQSEQQS